MGTYFYRVNTKHPILKDKRIRLALAYAINREQIVKKVSKCGQPAAYSFTPPGSAGYEPQTNIPYDPELARSLLAEAGYANGDNFPILEILFNTQEGHRKIALAIQQMWQENLGISIQLVNQDWKVYLAREMTGDFQISRAGWIGDYEDPNTFLDLLRLNRGNNKTGWENIEYDQLLELANSTNDQVLRYEYLNQAEKLLKHAKIKNSMLFVGQGKTFQIWEPTAFEKFRVNARKKSNTHRANLKWEKQFNN